MNPGRPITVAEVSPAQLATPLSFVSVADFLLGRSQPLQLTPDVAANAIPYCIDFERQRAVYALAENVLAAREAPFQYTCLRRAKRIVSVPWENGPILAAAHSRRVVFAFSPGRCGSTLVTRLLQGCGVATLSEPDFYSQAIVAPQARSMSEAFRNRLGQVLADLTADLLAACWPQSGSPVLIKLRSQCCEDPELILRSSAAPLTTVFIVRRFDSWVPSFMKAFGIGPQAAVDHFARAIECYRFLRVHSDCHLIRYEDFEGRLERVTASLSTAVGVDISPEAASAAVVAAGDSQSGTSLAQERLAHRRVDRNAVAEAVRLWEIHPARDLLAEEGLGVVA